MRRLCCALLGILISGGICAADEFAPDEHTLLLAHFNTDTRWADYATGWRRFAGNGAGLTTGYYGNAADLRYPQITTNYQAMCDDFVPRYDGWGFQTRGNMNFRQGTFECWFQVAPGGSSRCPRAGTFLGADVTRAVKSKTGAHYVSIQLDIGTLACRYLLPFLSGDYEQGAVLFRAVPGYGKALVPGDWHHLALCWSPGEIIAYLDGQPLFGYDMTGRHGLAFIANPVRYVHMSHCILDELRVSSTVRYAGPFEPAWRDGARPDFAFSGVPGVKRYPPKTEAPPIPTGGALPASPAAATASLGGLTFLFDRDTGRLCSLGTSLPQADGGLLLWEGLAREPVAPTAVQRWRTDDERVTFRQNFGDLWARHALDTHRGAVRWRITLRNDSDRERWLEALLSLPVPLDSVAEFFSGADTHTQLGFPRRWDEYMSALPFAAVAGNGRFLGAGIDPHVPVSDIISEWLPAAAPAAKPAIRQGTRIALAPGESYTYTFYIVHGASDFGALDAIDAFQALFPDLYHLRPDVPVYSYMPTAQYMVAYPYADQKRIAYVGGFWGHGPGHTKADMYGSAAWWDNPAFYEDPSYKHAMGLEKLWGNLDTLRRVITLFNRRSYDNYYAVRRTHYCPDQAPVFIVKDLMPGYVPTDDPLYFGNYYYPSGWLVNEYRTPVGNHIQDNTRRYWRQKKGYSPGFINDMSHSPLLRAADPWAKRTPGRSFAHDLGTFIRRALGRQDRYAMVNRFVDNGHRATMWSDGGAFAYTICAYSSAVAVEGADRYADLTGPGEYLVRARHHLLGEKPITVLNSYGSDWIGNYHKPEDFTPASLRDFYRYNEAQLNLYCLKHGVTLAPPYVMGRQLSLETVPLMVESTVLGRRNVPAARVTPPLWVRRAGRGTDTLLVIGNTTPEARETDVDVVNRYVDGAPLFGPYFGGELPHSLRPDRTTVHALAVPPRAARALKMLGLLRFPAAPAADAPPEGTAQSQFAGDGLTLEVRLELDLAAAAELTLNPFAPLYGVQSLRRDGQPVPWDPTEPLRVPAGRSAVTALYTNRALAFTRADWEAVELIKDRKTHFRIVADAGRDLVLNTTDRIKNIVFTLGFERGTAMLLNEFLAQYDEEDGILGNLAPAPIVAEASGDFDGWTVVLREDFAVGAGRVRVDRATRVLTVEGGTQGELRRAMTVLLRLVDRTYPHVGRMTSLKGAGWVYNRTSADPIDKWFSQKPTKEFFKAFTDPHFIIKPILKAVHEPLYADGNMDFTGKYDLRWSPYIFEPTYGDDFVHGYAGRGTVETPEDLHRLPK